jgi:hypothetical protein
MTTRFEQLLVLPLALAIFIALSATPTPAAMIAVTNDVASNTTWFATNTYLLQTVVFVRSNVTLTIEAGTIISISAAAVNLQPKSWWTIQNATLIGRGKDARGFGGGVAWNSRDEAAPNVFNSIIAEFAAGVLIDNDAGSRRDSHANPCRRPAQ